LVFFAFSFGFAIHLRVAAEPVADQPPQMAFGTGFSVDDGYFLTAYHVIKNSSQILVGTADSQRWHTSELVKFDPVLDLALLKTKLKLPVLGFVKSDQVPIGWEIFVVGYPGPKIQGLTPKITQGIINGYQTAALQADDRGYFQLSAEVARGNSGGPLIGADGSVVGMIQRKLDSQKLMDRTQELVVNISYALRSSHILNFLEGTPVNPHIQKIHVDQPLRAYQIYQQVTPSVVSIIGRNPDQK